MKKSILSILFVLSFASISCNSQKKSTDDSFTVDYQIKSNYLLLPVEESAPEIKISVSTKGPTTNATYDMRLAVSKIDYWVPVDVKKWKGSNVTLTYFGLKESVLGVNEVKQSNKFEFEYNEPYRPQFHFSPEYGWMNDPNGMVYLDGEYHLFYQYNPYGNKWGNMHWGHAVSTDLTSWTYLPTSLTPDSLGAIFSGSAVIDVNNTAGYGKNTMVAIYTSCGKTQQQSIAYSTDKGRTFTKYAGNPVIPNPGITDFRDPKVSWSEQSKQWVMALATKQTITFYGSPDLKKWSKLSEFASESGAHGGVWECPDLFPLTYEGKTKWVLLVSINPGGPNGGSATQYFIGNFDGKTFTADNLPYPLWLDYGRDNYAGVTFSNIPQNDGRRIFIGWMSNWDYANDVPTKNFRSVMTVARELKLTHNGQYLMVTNSPVSEVNHLRGQVNLISDIKVSKQVDIDQLLSENNGTYEIEMTIRSENAQNFGFKLENSKGENLKFNLDLIKKELNVDRTQSGKSDFSPKFNSIAKAPINKKDIYKIRLLVDKASVELFINDGETVLTNIVFPTEPYNSMSMFTSDEPWFASDIKIYDIK